MEEQHVFQDTKETVYPLVYMKSPISSKLTTIVSRYVYKRSQHPETHPRNLTLLSNKVSLLGTIQLKLSSLWRTFLMTG